MARRTVRSSATALQQLAADPRYHPHIHYLVPGGALAPNGAGWLGAPGRFLVHTKPLAALFRGKVRAGLRQLRLEAEVACETWSKPWVVDCRPVGSGQAALKYLAPYVFRVALSNNRIVSVVDDQVTFRYRVSDTKKTKRCTVPAEEFMRRFLQHVLPKGFVKVRYYGLFSPGKRQVLAQVRETLREREGVVPMMPVVATTSAILPEKAETPRIYCPACGTQMEVTELLMPSNRGPPGARG